MRQGITDRILFPGFVAFHHGLQIPVGNHAGSVFIDVLAILILAGNHRARNPCLPIDRELHPHAFAKPVLVYTIGTNNNGFPGSFVSGICIGNLSNLVRSLFSYNDSDEEHTDEIDDNLHLEE